MKTINFMSKVRASLILSLFFAIVGCENNPYSEQFNIDASSAINLSENGTANCYVVSAPGVYKFKAVIGNGSDTLNNVSRAEILWESFGTDTTTEHFALIKGVSFKDGVVAFQTNGFSKGNAVIAVKDSDGKILWSWHIWFREPISSDTSKVMNMNLGAISTLADDPTSLGLLYQWGRKDAFLNSCELNHSNLAKSTGDWSKTESNLETGNIEYSIAHPTTFITYNASNYDWLYLGGPLLSENSRWSTEKTIYDPCPVGWRVATLDEYKALDLTDLKSGYLAYNTGVLSGVGLIGFWWACEVEGPFAKCYTLSEDFGSHNAKSLGFSVRCVRQDF